MSRVQIEYPYPRDSEGNEIHIDDTVAFNQSGAVRRGTVVAFRRRTDSVARRNPFWNDVQWIIGIDLKNGTTAAVKNTSGILIIG